MGQGLTPSVCTGLGRTPAGSYRRSGALIQWFFLVLLLYIPVLAVADITGPVISVLDGDVIEVLYNTQPECVRLSSIDCPEKGQAFGNRALKAALVFGRDVMLHTPRSGQVRAHTRRCDIAGWHEHE